MFTARSTVALALAALFLAAPLAVPLGDAGPVPTIALQLVASGFIAPLLATHADDGSGRLFIVEQRGTVRVLQGGVLDPAFYLDLRGKVTCCGERGLLGLAFHPDFASNGKVFASYTGAGGSSVLERFTVADPAADRPSLASGEVLLTVSQPFSNHNGGNIVFGPDGFLYLGLGDGGSGGDPLNHGQNPNTLLGAMLRLDVDGPGGYAVPADNPFVNGGGRPEIWATGLRNPWRFSFDRATGDLWIADVGQNLVEEVNLQKAGAAGGANYGWNQWEGHNPYRPATANPAGKTFPVLEYLHTGHCSITGGHVYRGAAIPALVGVYLYGDYCSGVIWGGFGAADGYVPVQLLDSPWSITSFGEDEAGEVYLIAGQGGVYRIVSGPV